MDQILDAWEEMRPEAGSSHHKKGFGDDNEGQSGVTELKRAPLRKEIPIMFRRHIKLIIRDRTSCVFVALLKLNSRSRFWLTLCALLATAILYAGRAVVFLVANTIFSLVYLKARKFTQDQALNKMWINIWHVGVASNMGAVAVYALNDEFKSILREAKNGMTGPFTYAMAKTVLILPIILCFAISSS